MCLLIREFLDVLIFGFSCDENTATLNFLIDQSKVKETDGDPADEVMELDS